MVIITFATLREYALVNTNIKVALYHWYKTVEKADWNCLADIKQDYPSVDFLGNDRYVFNIKGNHYRVIAMIHFSIRTVYIRFIGTHAEYDKIADITNL